MSFLNTLGGAVSNFGDSVLSDIKSAASDGLSSLFPGAGGPSRGGSRDTAGYYKVLIQAKTRGGDIRIAADGPQQFSFATSLNYESPYQDMAENLVTEGLNKLPGGSAAAGFIKGSGTKLFTQALTAKVWTGASETTINVPLILQAETDADKDVLAPLMKLMYLSMPREEEEGGLLSAPGPVFDFGALFDKKGNNPSAHEPGAISKITGATGNFTDPLKGAVSSLSSGNIQGALNQAVGGGAALTSALSDALKGLVKYPITLQIGQGFRLENVVIESVTQTHNLSPVGGAYGKSSGINSRVQVEVTFKTFYTLTQRDIVKMLLPMSSPGSATNAEYRKLIR